MKNKILYLIVGILIGAIITAGCFLIFAKNSKTEMPEDGKMPNMEQMRENGEFERGGRKKSSMNTNSDNGVKNNKSSVENETNE